MISYIIVIEDFFMKVYEINTAFNNIPKLKNEISLCLGYFDGVHIAHQRLINNAIIHSDNPVGIITFNNNIKNRQGLTSLNSRINLFKLLNIEYVFVLPFTKKVKNMSHILFKEKFLDQLNIDQLFVGEDFAFGKNKKGNIEYLKKYYSVKVIKFIKKENKKISSYEIAEFIRNGDIKKANAYLGRPYQIRGRVIRGFQKGRKLNFPTANIKILDDYVVPKFGVYKVITYVFGIPRLAIANVGVHPTINKLDKPIIEVHIFNYSSNLYNREIYIEFIDFIRDEKKFKNENELVEQIKKDMKIAKNV